MGQAELEAPLVGVKPLYGEGWPSMETLTKWVCALGNERESESLDSLAGWERGRTLSLVMEDLSPDAKVLRAFVAYSWQHIPSNPKRKRKEERIMLTDLLPLAHVASYRNMRDAVANAHGITPEECNQVLGIHPAASVTRSSTKHLLVLALFRAWGLIIGKGHFLHINLLEWKSEINPHSDDFPNTLAVKTNKLVRQGGIPHLPDPLALFGIPDLQRINRLEEVIRQRNARAKAKEGEISASQHKKFKELFR